MPRIVGVDLCVAVEADRDGVLARVTPVVRSLVYVIDFHLGPAEPITDTTSPVAILQEFDDY
jgi:hypothetical protein